ncbi:MAG: spermidine synthase [Planctomycetes bacterium]|nr:spermidine synthase [Planctomycetota bacterium]
MKPHELVGSARVPGHDAELRCYRHDGDFTIWLDRVELMSSRVTGSEQMLAELALECLGARSAPRVLVGGLGMGFTLARVLALADAEAAVEVVELVPEVVTWNRDLLGQCAGHPLRDARTHLVLDDVGDVIRGAEDRYDAILLDVDNGPEGLSRPRNERLYGDRGLLAIHRALRPGGVLAVWSSADNRAFDKRVRRSGFHVTEHHVRARRTKGPRRTIWVARRTEPEAGARP